MKGGSMVRAEIAEPYAQAIMSVARSHDLAEQIGNDIRSLLSLLENSPELRQFIANPFIQEDDKKAVLQQIGGEDLHPYLHNFLMLLIDRRRIVFLEEIAQKYLELLRELNQTVLAQVISAVELSDAQKQSVREKVIAMTGAREVELNAQIDPELIGGVIIKVGSQIVDASLRAQLRRIGMRLTSAA